MKKQLAVLVVVLASPGLALAAAQDYSSVTSAFTTELAAAFPIALGIFGTTLAIGYAWKLLRKSRS